MAKARNLKKIPGFCPFKRFMDVFVVCPMKNILPFMPADSIIVKIKWIAYKRQRKRRDGYGAEKKAGDRHEGYFACGDAGAGVCDGSDPGYVPGIWFYPD